MYEVHAVWIAVKTRSSLKSNKTEVAENRSLSLYTVFRTMITTNDRCASQPPIPQSATATRSGFSNLHSHRVISLAVQLRTPHLQK